ncbi:M48 family metallopeptidase [Micromonospora qiuiae]|uniref:M48 family metallopeptidase n=1 Tax=Micromonospora qiuiae TaxID=502268 RepID=UPI0019525927|nr:M48 family metallopeptidase [Micromonospora qiuiae]
MTTISAATECPRCGTPTVSQLDATAWCPSCEWNLEAYDAGRSRPVFGWGWVDRRAHRLAYRMTREHFDRLVKRPIGATGAGAARALTIAASVLLLSGVAALAVTGAWLAVRSFPSLTLLPGLALLGVAYVLRPRFGRLDPELEVLSRQRAPELFALVDEVATALGAPAPQVIGVDGELNAYAGQIGLRQRRVLCLGLPYWGSLGPQERVALLGHELGHFVNGDPRRMVLTQPAFRTLGDAADLLRPMDTGHLVRPGVKPVLGMLFSGSLLERLGAALGRVLLGTLSRLFAAGHLVLVCLALRESQRAEYLADEMSAKVAGSDGTARLLDSTLRLESMALAVRRESLAGHGPDRWRAAVAESLAAAADRLPQLRQLSVREEASLFASHPPTGLRRQMLASRDWHDPLVVLTEARAERIDAELAREYERVRRQISLR